jgi:hypothetical protein
MEEENAMEAVPVESSRSVGSSRIAGATAYLGALAFLVAGVWYGLAVEGVTVASEPSFSPGQSFDERLGIYYRWFDSTLQQERLYGSISIFGFLCLAATAAFLRPRLGRGDPLTLLGVQGIGAGVILWVVGGVEQLGGHQAVGQMVNSRNPLETVNSIAFTIDKVNDAFQLGALLLIGAGLVALALRAASREAAWSRCTLAVALVVLAAAGAYAAGAFDLVDLLLVVGGAVALPAWLVWSGRVLGRRVDPTG